MAHPVLGEEEPDHLPGGGGTELGEQEEREEDGEEREEEGEEEREEEEREEEGSEDTLRSCSRPP